MLLKLNISNLNKNNAERFESETLKVTGVQKVDTWTGRAELEVVDQTVVPALRNTLSHAGFNIQPYAQVMKVCIDGMTCRSCELTIERKFKNVPGVHKVDVNARTGVARIFQKDGESVDVEHLKKALSGETYVVRGLEEKPALSTYAERPSLMRLVGLFALVFLLGILFDKIGIFGANTTVTQSMSFAAAVVLGLVAGTSSCLAVAGGLLLSSAAKFNERYREISSNNRFRPVFLFVLGRVVGYSVLGGLVGLLGTAFTFSPFVTGGLIVLAAVYMLIMGFDMLDISPRWLKACLPRIPKSISRRVIDAEGKEHWSAPFLLGAGTFFLPCGFTQALQVYALTTGSIWQSALMLGGFAVGTAPALLALGWASSSLKGKTGKFFFQFSGALVIVLGIWNIQSGLILAGVTTPNFDFEPVTAQTAKIIADPNVKIVEGVQFISMSLIQTDPYYSPSDEFTVKAGTPVRLQINGQGRGCRSYFQIPKLGVSTALSGPKTVMDFTPQKPGRYAFSCSMGMYRGALNVVSS
jgi:sulfite exporter TauE/SafE/copper chaperone CopZ